METLLWICSTGAMLALLILLALRALDELLGVKLRLPAFGGIARLSPACWPWPVILIASVGILWLSALAGFAAGHGIGDHFLNRVWVRFTEAGDAPHYLYIAQHGYESTGENVNNIVFYPLYPLLMAGLGRMLGGRYALAGMIISQVSYGLAGVVMSRLAKKDCPHPGAALAAFWLYPFGFFCMGVYTEGLFLLLTLLGLLAIRERKWALAGVASFLCALTRTQGILLLLPGVYSAWRNCRKHGWTWRYLYLTGPMLGFAAYLCCNKAVCGSFFAYQYYESIEPWWQTPQWLGDTLAQQFTMGTANPGLANWIYWPQLFIYFIAAALLVAAWRRQLDSAHILYGTAYLGMSYTASWLISGSRYMLGCVPMYLAVGSFKERAIRALILLSELAFLVYYAARFMEGQAIM